MNLVVTTTFIHQVILRYTERVQYMRDNITSYRGLNDIRPCLKVNLQIFEAKVSSGSHFVNHALKSVRV